MDPASIVLMVSTAVAAVAKAIMEGAARAGLTQEELDAAKTGALAAVAAIDTEITAQVAKEWRIAHGMDS